jgi:hypothetical protein
MNHPLGRFRSSCVAASVILVGLCSARDSWGQIVSPRVGMKAAQMTRHRPTGMRNTGNRSSGYNRAARGNGQQVNNQLVAELRGTMALLHQADHDYNGHRVLAIQHLSRAVHTIHPNTNGGQANGMNRGQGNGAMGVQAGVGGNGGNRAGGANGQNKMPQAQSDQHLQQAMQRLSVIHNQISNVGSNQRHSQALGHIQQATQELRTALNIR